MKRKAILVLSGVALTALVVAGGFFWAANRPPAFYRTNLDWETPPNVRQAAARQFAEQTATFVRDLSYSKQWEQEFTQSEINAWLATELPQEHGHQVPKGVSDPVVQFDDGLIRIGFRLSSSAFSGIVSLDLRPDVPEPNRLSIAIESLSAGLIPLSPASFTADVSKQLDRHEIEHEWRVVEDRHVLDVTIAPDRDDHPVLEEIAVERESLRIAGRRDDPNRLTMLRPVEATRL